MVITELSEWSQQGILSATLALERVQCCRSLSLTMLASRSVMMV